MRQRTAERVHSRAQEEPRAVGRGRCSGRTQLAVLGARCRRVIDIDMIQKLHQLEGTNEIGYYNGFLMATNCGIIAENGETEDPNQAHILL